MKLIQNDKKARVKWYKDDDVSIEELDSFHLET